ncbi:TetR/AcrR family transcriptional regulator C-terminal domain-containing protein [Lacticaseibacillus nasuensis]|uniref:TetR/AcrR family transcriptional regulator C-terminal domain-containing protein n=1 Tax=Lacticaseibacillus nasuensis TaxID=944671 RepID=UPI000A4120D7|nr:TetR/AcrR family transcriptional regulator C-terminal domain-containing protein [Lacticaseibacillus nasuensis]
MASTDTKLRLAHTLRAMMATTALDHITISALTKQAGVTRNTFYYHFEDIYSLLAWVYEQEIIVQMAKYAQITEWQKALRMLLDYIEENREFCVASFHSVGRDLLEQLLATVADAWCAASSTTPTPACPSRSPTISATSTAWPSSPSSSNG